MTTVTIEESGLKFGPYDVDSVFHIEKCDALRRTSGVKSVEFILRRPHDGKRLVFVEAKSSVPRDSERFSSELAAKFCHSLGFFTALVLGRHETPPPGLASLLKVDALAEAEFVLALVVPDAPEDQLPDLTDKLRQSLATNVNILGSPRTKVQVLNRERASRLLAATHS